MTLATGKNIYCCLECGKFYQGRQLGTPAYEHAVSSFHSEYLNLATGQAYSLPDGTEIRNENEAVLGMLRENLKPQSFSLEATSLEDLQGRPYIRGLVPILGSNFGAIALVHLVAHIEPLVRQLLALKEGPERLLQLSWIIRKLWMRERMLKGRILFPNIASLPSVYPEKMLPVLLHGLDLRCMQGQLSVSTCPNEKKHLGMSSSLVNFTTLAVDLPPLPLFPDPSGKLPIPQVPLSDLINQKYNSGRVHYDAKGNPVAYDITSLPEFLVITINGRQQKDTKERNGTVVLFDTESLQVPCKASNHNVMDAYKLQASVCIDYTGIYASIVRREGKEFYLHEPSGCLKPIAPESVVLQEAVVQLWKRVEEKMK